MNKQTGGFTGIEVLIAIVIVGAISGAVAWIFKDELAGLLKSPPAEEAGPELKNPFPAKSATELKELPPEPSKLPASSSLVPMVSEVNKWDGTYELYSSLQSGPTPQCVDEAAKEQISVKNNQFRYLDATLPAIDAAGKTLASGYVPTVDGSALRTIAFAFSSDQGGGAKVGFSVRLATEGEGGFTCVWSGSGNRVSR